MELTPCQEGKRKTAERSAVQIVKKVVFIKIEQLLYPYPQTPSPWEGAILLGLPPLDPVGGYAPATPFFYKHEVFKEKLPKDRQFSKIML